MQTKNPENVSDNDSSDYEKSDNYQQSLVELNTYLENLPKDKKHNHEYSKYESVFQKFQSHEVLNRYFLKRSFSLTDQKILSQLEEDEGFLIDSCPVQDLSELCYLEAKKSIANFDKKIKLNIKQDESNINLWNKRLKDETIVQFCTSLDTNAAILIANNKSMKHPDEEISKTLFIAKYEIPNHTAVMCLYQQKNEKGEIEKKVFIVDPNTSLEKDHKNKISLLLQYIGFVSKNEEIDITLIPIKFQDCDSLPDNCAMYPIEYIKAVELNLRDYKEFPDINKMLLIEQHQKKNENDVIKAVKIQKSVSQVLLSYVLSNNNMTFEKHSDYDDVLSQKKELESSIQNLNQTSPKGKKSKEAKKEQNTLKICLKNIASSIKERELIDDQSVLDFIFLKKDCFKKDKSSVSNKQSRKF